MAQTDALRLLQTATLAVILELHNWTGGQNLVTTPTPVMRHMRESPIGREWCYCFLLALLFIATVVICFYGYLTLLSCLKPPLDNTI